MVCKILDELLEKKEIHSAVELGGFPGTFSVYLKRKYKTEATLFDYFIDEELFKKFTKVNNVNSNEIKLIEDDLINYKKKEDQLFDLVYSIGLIEHFKDVKNIINKHTFLMEDGGELLIIIPNFRGVNGWAQKRFDKENYKIHNIECMDPDYLSKIALDLGLKNVESYYSGGFSVWIENNTKQNIFQKAIVKLIWIKGKIIYKLIRKNTKLLSPYIVIDGLKRPGKLTNLKLKYLDHLNGPAFFGIHKGGYSAINNGSIKIWKGVPMSFSSGVAKTDVIYSTTIHEIAHTSHKKLIGNWIGTDDIIIESWAEAVEWHLTKLEYNSLGEMGYDIPETSLHRDNKQRWIDFGKNYTPIFIDLVDDFNQALRSKEYSAATKSWQYPSQYCKLGTMDGSGNCYIETAPPGETAHVKTNNNLGNYALYFYYTPIGCCSCPLPFSGLTSNHECQLLSTLLPRDVVPFVVDSKVMYVRPSGSDLYPYDEFSGLTMSYIETHILPNVKDMGDLSDEVYTHKPSNTNPNVITNLFKLYP